MCGLPCISGNSNPLYLTADDDQVLTCCSPSKFPCCPLRCVIASRIGHQHRDMPINPMSPTWLVLHWLCIL